jgi:uncharacterized membrane protein
VLGPAALAAALYSTLPLAQPRPGEGPPARLTAALVGPLLFLPFYRCWTQGLGDGLIGLLPLLLGANALLGALVLVRRHRAHRGDGTLAIFVGVALLGLTVALPLQLSNQWLTVSWALEAAALAWLSQRLRHPLLPWASALLGYTVTARLVLNPEVLTYGDASGDPIFNWTLYTWGLPALALVMQARWLRDRLPRPLVAGLGVAAIAVGFALVNVQVSDFFQDSGPIELSGRGLLQGMVRSLSWAAYGAFILMLGLWRDSRSTRLIGFAIVLLATAKVFVVDLWTLSGFVRVGSMLGLGLTLLGAALLFERLVLRRPSPGGDDPNPDPPSE